MTCNRETKKGGGVAIYVKNGIDHSLVEELTFTIHQNIEAIGIRLNSKKHGTTYICCIYRAPNYPVDPFLEQIQKIMDHTKHRRTFICGDFNIDLIKSNSSHESRDLAEIMNSRGMIPLINSPTRITRSTATIIDNIYTNEIRNTIISGIVIEDISDHLPIFALCDLEIQKHTSNYSREKKQMNKP